MVPLCSRQTVGDVGGRATLKLAEDAEVAVPERANVGEIVPELRDALDPAAEGEA